MVINPRPQPQFAGRRGLGPRRREFVSRACGAWADHFDRAGRAVRQLETRYFGRTEGSPPGLPGGGITGMLPPSGVGARISGSIPAGGHSTPSDLASLSPSGSVRWPVVVPSGADGLGWAGCCIGAQLLDLAGGAVWAGGVVGAGGACAMARPGAAINTHESRSDWLIRMGRERPADAVGSPAKTRRQVS
jgi:hypothetical protein